jgi:hypothetical protein
MLGRANDRIDRLNQSNQRWGMPPIPYESEMAPLTPRAYNAPVGVNAPPSGMSNLKDAKAAAAQKAIIEQMLEGKNP